MDLWNRLTSSGTSSGGDFIDSSFDGETGRFSPSSFGSVCVVVGGLVKTWIICSGLQYFSFDLMIYKEINNTTTMIVIVKVSVSVTFVFRVSPVTLFFPRF